MRKRKRTDRLAPRLKTVQTLFYVNTFIWFCLGTYLAIVMFKDNNGLSIGLVGFFLYSNAAAMFVSGIYLGKKVIWAYYFSLIVLIINAVVAAAGAFGLFDIFAILFDLVIFGLLISLGKAYLRRS